MAYISYKDVPLYFGTSVNSNTFPTTNDGDNYSVFCQQVQLNYTPNIAPVRLLGKTPTRDNFNLAGPPNASLSFSCYVGSTSSEFSPTDYTGDVGDIGTTFRLGDDTNGISGSGAFLTSFSYTLAPYTPVLVQCDFAIYSPLTISNPGGKIVAESADPIDNLDFANYGHGAYSVFSGNGSTASATLGNDINTFESVQYQFSANRLPVYEIGSYTPSVVELITAEHGLTIQGDNITQLVPITGSNPGELQLQIKNSSSSTPLFTSSVNGRITAENVSIQGGDLARGNITITELLK